MKNRLYEKFVNEVAEVGEEIYSFANDEEKAVINDFVKDGHSETELAFFVEDNMPELKDRISEYVRRCW